MTVYTKPAAEVFAPTESDGSLRGANMGEAQTWGTEVEARIDQVAVSVASGIRVRLAHVDLATTANIALSGEQTIDGTLTSTSRVLVKDQSSKAENGIYVTAAGAWSRATDADTTAEIYSSAVYVSGGTANVGETYWCDLLSTETLGTDAHDWILIDDVTNVGASIFGAPAKTAMVDADTVAITDSAASNVLKKITWANVKATIWSGLGALISGGTGKTTPVDADTIPISDSEAASASKKVSLENLKAMFFASPTLTGTPTVPTAALGTDTTQAASTAFVLNEVEVEAARAQAAESVIGRSAGRLIPIIGKELSGASVSQWTTDGDLVAVKTAASGEIKAAFSRFMVPRVAGMNVASFDADGAIVSASDIARSYMVPRISFVSSGAWNIFGEAVRLDTGAAGSSLDVDERSTSAPISGRDVPQLWLKRSDAKWVRLTFGPFGAQLVSIGSEEASLYRRGRLQTAKWRATELGAGTTLHLLLGVGQSLKQGYVDTSGDPERAVFWRDPAHERAWQFDGAAADGFDRGPRPFQVIPAAVNKDTVLADTQIAKLVPLRGNDHLNDSRYFQTDMETMAAALLGQHLHRNDHVLAAIIGTDATAIVDFAAATEHMQSVEKIITKAADIADLLSLDLSVWLIWNQGEQDNSLGTASATWKSAWTAIRDHISAYTVTAGGTFGGSLMQQTMQRPAGVTGMATTAQAELIAAGEAIGIATYPMLPGWPGTTHFYPETYFPLGCQCAYAIAETIANAAPYVAPHIAAGDAVLTDSTTIDCTVTGGSGVFEFDIDTIPDAADRMKGITVADDNGAVAISSLAWTGNNTLRITLAGAVVIGDGPLVRFGLAGTANLSPSAGGPRVNIRDNSAWPCGATGQIVSGWMIAHEVAVTAP